MAIVVADRIKQYTTISGTGSISFSGTVTGYKAFSDALSSGDETLYCVLDGANGETGWEVGVGTFNGTTLSRDTVLASSTGSKISLSGNVSEVFITYAAGRSLSYDSAGTKVGINTASPSYTLDVFGHDAWVQASGITVGASGILPGITALDDARVSGTKTSTYLIDFGLSTSGVYLGNETQSNLSTANNNVHIGEKAGSGVTNASDNVIIGPLAGPHITTGSKNVVIGSDTSIASSNDHNIFIGYQSADTTAVGDHSVGVGYRTGYDDGGRSVNIGHDAGWSDNSNSIYTTSVGYSSFTGSHNTTPPSPENSLRYGTAVGYQAGFLSYGSYSSTFIGALAGYEGPGWNSVCIGMEAGRGIKDVGKHDHLFIGNSQPSANGTLIKGMFNTKEVAVGKCDVGISGVATFQVYPNSATSKGILVKSAVSQSADLTQWQNSSSVVAAAMTPSGILNVYGVVASGDVTVVNLTASNNVNAFNVNATGHDAWVKSSGVSVGASGIVLAANAPAVTTNTLYNVGGALYFSGSELSTGGVSSADLTYVSGIAVYSSGQSIANESDIVASSGISAYASGQAIANEADIATNSARVTYASGQAIENESDIAALLAASGQAVYASGQTIENEGNITALLAASGQAVYASGNTANITFGSNAEGDILYHNGTSFVRLEKGTNNHVLTMDGNVPNWEASSGGGGTSAEATYASGQAIANEGDITALLAASGQAVYSSGVVTGGNPTFTDVQLGQYIYHDGDADTYIRFGANLVNVVAGGKSALKYDASSGKIIINNTNQNVDFHVMASDGEEVLATDAAENRVGINTTTPAYGLDVFGAGASGIIQATGVIVGASGTRWQDSAGGSIATMTPSGVLNAYGVVASGAGVRLHRVTPTVTTDSLYNVGGSLYFNGSALASAGASAEATYASGQAIANESDIVAVTGIAAYASGQANANMTNFTISDGSTTQTVADGNTVTFSATSNETTVAVSATDTVTIGLPNDVTIGSDLTVTDSLVIDTKTLVANAASYADRVGIGTATPGYTLDVFGHDAWVQASGVRVGASGIILNGTAITATAAELNIMDGNTSATTPTVGGSDAFVMNDGGTMAQVDIDNVDTYLAATTKTLTNKTLTSPKINEDVVVSATATEINLLDGVNATTAELNYVDVTAGTATASKALVLDSAISFTGAKHGVFNQADSWVKSSGVKVGASGIIMQDADLSHTITLKTPDTVSTSFTFTLPSGIGSNGQVLTTDGVQTYWSTVSSGGGDITGVTAGTLLDGGGSSGDVTLNVDLTEAAEASIANGDYILFLDGGATGSHAKEAIADVATLFAGDGLTASNSVLAVNVDDSTIETNSDAIRVKDAGISLAKMANLADMKAIGNTSGGAATPAAVSILDEDNMASNSATSLVTQQSVSAFVAGPSGIAAYASGQANAKMTNFIISDGSTTQTVANGNTITFAATSNETTVAVSATDTVTIGLPNDVTIGSDLTVTDSLVVDTKTLVANASSYADRVGIGTAAPGYTLDVFGHDAWVQASGVRVGASGIILGGTAVTATAAELNYLDITTLGTAAASKAMTWAADSTWTAAGGTCANLGTVTTADINGGTIDGATIATSNVTVGSSKTLDVSGGTLTTSAAQKQAIVAGADGAAIDNCVIGGSTPAAATFTTVQANTSIVPDAAGGADLGSTSAEWGDVYIADDKKIKFGNGQDASIEYDEDGTDTLSISGVPVTFNKAVKHPIKANTDDTTVTFDLNESNMHTVALEGSRTFATTNATIGQRFIIRIKQDGSTRTVTWGAGSPNSFGTILWAGGSAPDLTDGGNKADIIGFICTAEGTPNSFDGFVVAQNI
jgi:hypothetical protein